MPSKTNDFIKAVDFTAELALDPSDLNVAQDELKPETDRGFVVWTTDIAGSPVLPTITGDLVRVKRYIWLRQTADEVICYTWNDTLTTSDAIFDKWEELRAAVELSAVETSSLSSTVAGFGLYYSATNGISVRLSTTTIAQLRQIVATNIPDGTVIFVRGYYTDNDGGGGLFVKKTGAVVDDAGKYIVYAPGGVTTTSYWERILDNESKVRPEFFGAKGDGVTDDTLAIDRCMKAYGRVDFMGKTYILQALTPGGLGSAITLSSGRDNIFTGEGMDFTTLKVKDNAQGPPDVVWFAMFQNADFSDSVDSCVFRDFTIDNNFNGQTGLHATTTGINVLGSNNLAERIRVINFGVGTTQKECFCILFTRVPGTIDKRGNKILHCEATSPGYRAGSIAELSLFTISSFPGATPNYDDIQEQPEISYCKAWDIRASLAQPSQCHFISISGGTGAKIIGNTCTNVDGVGLYIQLYHNYDMQVIGNSFINVWYGIQFLGGLEAGTGNVEYDLHLRDVLISDNIIKLQTVFDATWVIPGPCTGIMIYAASQFNSAHAIYSYYDNIVIANNIITGKSFLYGAAISYPYGIYVNTIGSEYRITCRDNIIEVPDTWDDTVTFKNLDIPYEFSITFAGGYSYKPESFTAYNNKNKLGFETQLRILQTTPTPCIYRNNHGYNFETGAAVPVTYPTNYEQIHFDPTSQRVYFPIGKPVAIASGSLVPGKTYRVITDQSSAADHVDYDNGGGLNDYFHNETFVCVAAHLTYTATANAVVYEDCAYFWKELGVEKILPAKGVTVAAGVGSYELNLNTTSKELEGLVGVVFDTTAGDKTVYLPDPTYAVYKTLKLAITKAVPASSTNKIILAVGTIATPINAKLISDASELPVNTIDLTTATNTIARTSVILTCDGSHWYVK